LIVGGTIEKEGRVLLVRHSDPRKKDYNHWLLPAGRVEPGESTLEALRREMREELGIEVKVEGILGEHMDDYTGQRFVNYLCHPASNEISISGELSEYRWVSKENVEGIGSIHPGLKRFLLNFFEGKQVVVSNEGVKRFGAVVLAAGKSSRMGENKLLLMVGGKTVLDRLLDALTQAVDEVVVVTGNNPDPIRAITSAHGVHVAHNPDHEKGMTTSFQAGLRAMGDVDAVFLVLGDQLGLASELLRRLAAVMEDVPGALIVSPVHNGKRGHPVLFRSSLVAEMLALTGMLKEVVDRHADAHVHVEGGEWSTLDFDNPEDFKRAKRRFEH
jgi:CTP:molybdopterin cytidylyltransferase MocA/8-oxo-dGTP pyrophosphatase MutT (NUDIX family)